MGFFSNTIRVFGVSINVAEEIIKIIDETDKHVYELSELDSEKEKQTIRIFESAEKNLINGLNYTEHQIRHASVTQMKVDGLIHVLDKAKKDFENLKFDTFSHTKIGEELTHYISLLEKTLKAYITDKKGVEEISDIQFISSEEKKVISESIHLTQIISEIQYLIVELINVLVSMLHKPHPKQIKSFVQLSSSLKNKLKICDNVIKNIRQINSKIHTKIDRISSLDKQLASDLYKHIDEVRSKQNNYRVGLDEQQKETLIRRGIKF